MESEDMNSEGTFRDTLILIVILILIIAGIVGVMVVANTPSNTFRTVSLSNPIQVQPFNPRNMDITEYVVPNRNTVRTVRNAREVEGEARGISSERIRTINGTSRRTVINVYYEVDGVRYRLTKRTSLLGGIIFSDTRTVVYNSQNPREAAARPDIITLLEPALGALLGSLIILGIRSHHIKKLEANKNKV